MYVATCILLPRCRSDSYRPEPPSCCGTDLALSAALPAALRFYQLPLCTSILLALTWFLVCRSVPAPPPSMSSLSCLSTRLPPSLHSQVEAMLSHTVGAHLESTISYRSVAAAVPKMGECHVTTSCSANDTLVKV